jgi:hypothetical protein
MIAGTAQKTKIPNFRLMSIRVEPPFQLKSLWRKNRSKPTAYGTKKPNIFKGIDNPEFN